MYKREIGAILGVIVALIIWVLPISGLSAEGKKGLAVSLFGVVWWAFGIMQAGYTALPMLVAWVLFGVAPMEAIFQTWASPNIYLVIGGCLIAATTEKSGLGRGNSSCRS